jgi:hypothetical protein
MLLTAGLFPVTCFGIAFVLNTIAIFYQSLAAVSPCLVVAPELCSHSAACCTGRAGAGGPASAGMRAAVWLRPRCHRRCTH